MGLLFNWRLWAAGILAAAFSAGCWKSYVAGKNSVQKEFDAYRTEQTAQALSESMARRHREEVLQAKVKESSNAYQSEKKRRAADAVAAADSLRDFQAALGGAGDADTAAGNGANGTGGLERELLNACSAIVVNLGKEADRLEAKVIGLQDYIKSVGLDK